LKKKEEELKKKQQAIEEEKKKIESKIDVDNNNNNTNNTNNTTNNNPNTEIKRRITIRNIVKPDKPKEDTSNNLIQNMKYVPTPTPKIPAYLLAPVVFHNFSADNIEVTPEKLLEREDRARRLKEVEERSGIKFEDWLAAKKNKKSNIQ